MDRKNSKKQPNLSSYFQNKLPSNVRQGSIAYAERKDNVALIDGSIGSVSLPIHPKMFERLQNIGYTEGAFQEGIVKYDRTAGNPETQAAFKNILKQQGFDTTDLEVLVTDGSSMAMEISMLGIAGEPGVDEQPLLMFDPVYTNYNSVASRLGRKAMTVQRTLTEDGKFTFPRVEEIEATILKENPNGILIIPYDNPTGQMYEWESLIEIAKLCVKYNLWLLSDEAYRGLYYDENRDMISVWGVTDKEVPGIEGRRISLESSSKIWNACGLRIGAVVTDNKLFHQQAVADYTTNLSANSLGQYVFGALAHESKEEIFTWLETIRRHYKKIAYTMYEKFKQLNRDLIVSNPESSIYTVVDVRKIVKPGFNAVNFVQFCAYEGKVNVDGVETTLLVVPLTDFYNEVEGEDNPGRTQLRISYCEPIEKLEKIPYMLLELIKQYESQR